MASINPPGGRSAGPARFWRGLLLVALAVYALAAVYQVQLPGVNYDEALDAVPAMDVALGRPASALATVQIGGQAWPLMVMPYIGSTSALILLPGFRLLGVNVVTLRLPTILVGALVLLLCWGFLAEYLDERAAGLTVLLLALNPTYVFWSRMGGWVAQAMLPIFIVALWYLYRWYRQRRPAYLVAAALAMGFGLSTKLLFVWAWGGLAAAWLILTPWLAPGHGWRRWLWPVRGARAGTLALAAAAAGLGSGMVIWYNLRGAGTFHFIVEHILTSQMRQGLNPAVFGQMAAHGWHDLSTLLDGSWFGSVLGGPHTNRLAVPVFLVAVVVVVVLAAMGRLAYSARRLALLLILAAGFVVQASLLNIGHGAHHLVLVWPAPQVFVAVALLGLAGLAAQTELRPPRAWFGLILACALVIAGAEALTTYNYHRSLARSGGVGFFSDAVYELAHDLDQPGAPPAVALDWGFLRNVELLTEERANLVQRFTYTSPPGEEFTNYLNDLMRPSTTLYLFHVPDYTAYPGHWEVFDRVAYRKHLTPELWKTYRQRDGRPVYLAYTLKPAAPLWAVPPAARPLDLQVGQGLALRGYDLPGDQVRPGDTLQATLYWQAEARPARSYKVFAHLLDGQGRQWAIHDSVPVDWSYPTTQWQPGEVVADRLWLPLKPDTPAGTYTLFVGMYDEKTGQRLPLRGRNGEDLGDTTELATINVGN